MDIERNCEKEILTLSQYGYIRKILRVFNMDESKSVSTPVGVHFKFSIDDDEAETSMDDIPYANAIGSIMYAMIGTRCDLAYAFGLEDEVFRVEGFCDSDFTSDLDKRRSILGYVFMVGGNTINWRSSLQSVVALSTTEAEYVALVEAVKEGILRQRQCQGIRQELCQDLVM
ncbi:hypothetical protein YC2023_025119 [Brassica napus]